MKRTSNKKQRITKYKLNTKDKTAFKTFELAIAQAWCQAK